MEKLLEHRDNGPCHKLCPAQRLGRRKCEGNSVMEYVPSPVPSGSELLLCWFDFIQFASFYPLESDGGRCVERGRGKLLQHHGPASQSYGGAV
ncbi:hypothetical protein DPEC_G00340440 [Dallia pectoralis]|uniref:Uncharacterized protein n=1 Tax=Dallia pectoralis TaxID=75939 RepID=A0ACC2F5A4_DALPE|nr:hypothetical protein DPEC_G00340440 [Dallia pectoralis]